MADRKELRKYLSKYNESTVPDNYYYAYNILFNQSRSPRKEAILDQAVEDMQEEGSLRTVALFNRDRRSMGNLGERKYNWGSPR